MRLSPDQVVTPEAFAPQTAPISPAGTEYGEAATAATLTAIAEVGAPDRIAYGDDPAQRLDVYAPAGDAQAKRPVLVFLHGGGWVGGYLWWSGFMALAAKRHGFVLVAPTYRLGPQHRFPAQFEDTERVIEWTRANIASYGGDRDRMILAGHSAGAHLAALSTLRGAAPARLRGIVACFPVSAPFDLHSPNPAPKSLESRTYDYVLAKPDDDRAASPMNFVHAADVPFVVVYGERDFERIGRTTVAFDERMRAAGKNVTLRFAAGATHFDTHLALRDPAAPWYDDLMHAFAGRTPA
jgi:arylformamidase